MKIKIHYLIGDYEEAGQLRKKIEVMTNFEVDVEIVECVDDEEFREKEE